MHQLLKRLELIKTSIAIEDEEIIELQVMKIQKMDVDSDVKNILSLIENDDFSSVTVEIEKYISKFSGVVVYEDKELAGLRLELKSLEKKLQDLSAKKTEYLNDIDEFNIQFQLHLGATIREILKLKEKIAKKAIQEQQKRFDEEKERYQETKDRFEDIKEQKQKIESKLEDMDEFDDEYEEVYNEYQEIKDEYDTLEDEVNTQRKKTKEAKEELEDDPANDEYKEAKEEYEEFSDEYEDVKHKEESKTKLNDDEKKELKTLFRKACKLCHPDIVTNELKEKATEIMQSLNDAYAIKNMQEVKKILYSLENGTVFEVSSDSIDNKELLKEKIDEIKNSIYEIDEEIDNIKKDDFYDIMDNYDDVEIYFQDTNDSLQAEIERLRDIVDADTKIKVPKKEDKKVEKDADYWDIPF